MRAAVLKAVLNRSQKHAAIPSKEITVSLDPSNLSPGYRLGRLFAILEKIQEDAQPGINTTIRDRFYGAASSTPASVFPQLLKLKNHHLAKLSNPAFRRAFEARLGEVFDGLQSMPPHLPMEEQARFAIGYYHQRQALFTKSPKHEPAPLAQGVQDDPQ
jgi:CRISPR-associated protein Csd1